VVPHENTDVHRRERRVPIGIAAWAVPPTLVSAGRRPRDSDPGAVIAGATTTVDTVVLRRSFEGNPEWSVSGIVQVVTLTVHVFP
jgi:hypothetical protein